MRAAVIVALLALSTSLAAAQPALTPPSMTPETAAPPCPCVARTTEPVKQKDPSTATLLAITGTVLPVLITRASLEGDGNAAGVLLGLGSAVLLPSLGHWYAGKFFTPGMGLRLAGGTVAMFSLSILIEADDGGTDGVEKAFWLGAGTFVAGTIWDIATAGSAAREWNTKHGAISPTVMKTPAGGYGVGVAGAF